MTWGAELERAKVPTSVRKGRNRPVLGSYFAKVRTSQGIQTK